MLFPLLGYNVADIFWHSTCAVFPKLKWGNHGEWGLETRYRELHCIFSWATRIFISRCSRYFIRVSQTAYLIICQYLRHSYLSTYFLSRIVHLYKILVELYFIERIFFLSPLVHFECLVVDSVSHNIPRRCNPTILEKCFHHVST